MADLRVRCMHAAILRMLGWQIAIGREVFIPTRKSYPATADEMSDWRWLKLSRPTSFTQLSDY